VAVSQGGSCPTGYLGCFTKTSTVAGTANPTKTGFTYTATQVDPDQFVVLSKGTVNGRNHAAVATVRRKSRFDFAIFGLNGVDINGNCTGSLAADIGTSGTMTIHGPGHQCGGAADCFLANGNGNCTKSFNAYYIDPASMFVPVPTTGVTACTSRTFGQVGGVPITVDGQAGKPYVCTGTVTLGSMTITNGPLVVYMTGASASLAGVCGENLGYLVGSPDPVPPSQTIQIYDNQSTAQSITCGGSGGMVSFDGAFYMPNVSLRFNGSANPDIDGSVVVNTWRSNGGPNLSVPDSGLSSLVVNGWKAYDYREVSSTCAPPGNQC
jgi:hypothetical protein